MYKLPSTLGSDIQYIGSLINDFKIGKIPNAQFKAVRVPMGIYEQRQNGTYMLRIRCTGGFISPEQLKEVARVGAEINASHIHITSRQELQLHTLNINDMETAMQALNKVGLGTKGGGGNTIRNILVDIRSGITKEEVFNPYPYAVDLTTQLIAQEDSFTMPRKFKIAFAISEEKADYALINDLGLIPKNQEGKRGFKVYLGGSVASKPALGWLLFDFLPEEDLLRVAIAAKRFFSANGNRKNKHKARIRHIFYKLGEEETLALFHTYFEEAKQDESLSYVPSEIQFEYKEPSFSPLENTSTPFLLWKARYTKEQKQAKKFAVLVPFDHGNASMEVFAQIAAFAESFGNDVFRLTTRQGVQIRNIPEAYLTNLYALLKSLDFDIDKPLLLNNLLSCTGADTCRLGICLSKGASKALRDRLLRSELDFDELGDLKINISGCTNSCAQQIWADLGFSGRVHRNENMYPAYTVYAKIDGPRELGKSLGVISARDLPAFTEDVLRDYLARKAPVAYRTFSEYIVAEGKDTLVKLLAKYETVPSFEDDKNYYFDWGAKEIFSIASRGQAECSAGLFDMIDLDKKIIEDSRKALQTEADAEKKERLLYDIVYSSSRMLLVTKGVEPRTVEDAFTQFSQFFIHEGLVDKVFLEAIDAALQKAPLLEKTDLIIRLSDAVIALYQGMDDSLQFKATSLKVEAALSEEPSLKTEVKETKEVEPLVQEAKLVKDLRGVTCPMNFVKTKIALSSLVAGDKLEIWLDDGAPIENVPGSVRNEGHKILATTQVADYWKVLIEKKEL